MIEEVGASAKTLLARFTSGIKAGQCVVAAPWPAAEGQGTSSGASVFLQLHPEAYFAARHPLLWARLRVAGAEVCEHSVSVQAHGSSMWWSMWTTSSQCALKSPTRTLLSTLSIPAQVMRCRNFPRPSD